jgi:hypothetical protein
VWESNSVFFLVASSAQHSFCLFIIDFILLQNGTTTFNCTIRFFFFSYSLLVYIVFAGAPDRKRQSQNIMEQRTGTCVFKKKKKKKALYVLKTEIDSPILLFFFWCLAHELRQ